MPDALELNLGAPTAPEVDLGDVAPQEDSSGGPAAEVPQVSEEMVRGVLKGASGLLGTLIGDKDVPAHWRLTEEELDGLTPPLTRMANARPQLRAAFIRGDEATVALVLAGFASRNVADARRASSARKQADRSIDVASRPGPNPGPDAMGAAPDGGRPSDGPGRRSPWPGR